jgi:hypothetical protein
MTPVNINGREYFYKVVADYRFTPFHTTKFYIRGPIIIEDKWVPNDKFWKFFSNAFPKKIQVKTQSYDFCFDYSGNLEDSIDVVVVRKLEISYRDSLVLKAGKMSI